MDKELELKISKAITESLPAQLGEELRKQLELIPSLQNEVNQFIERNNFLRFDLDAAREKLTKAQEEISKHAHLSVREKAIQDAERKFEIEKLTYQLAAEKDKTEFAKGVALGLVRNAEYRTSVFEYKTLPMGLDQFGNPKTQTVHDNRNEDRTQL